MAASFCGLEGGLGTGETTADDVNLLYGIEFFLINAIYGTGSGLLAYSSAGRC